MRQRVESPTSQEMANDVATKSRIALQGEAIIRDCRSRPTRLRARATPGGIRSSQRNPSRTKGTTRKIHGRASNPRSQLESRRAQVWELRPDVSVKRYSKGNRA